MWPNTSGRTEEKGGGPPDLLTPEEKTELVAKCDHLSRLRFSPVLPFEAGQADRVLSV